MEFDLIDYAVLFAIIAVTSLIGKPVYKRHRYVFSIGLIMLGSGLLARIWWRS